MSELKSTDEMRHCPFHGYTVYKRKKSGLKQWYSCHKCLQYQWRKASQLYREKPAIREYQRIYSRNMNTIRRSLSLYVTIILIAAENAKKAN